MHRQSSGEVFMREAKPQALSRMKAFEQIDIMSSQDLRDWLGKNHTRNESVWIVTYKKKLGQAHVPWTEVVDAALCFGWIDSLPRKLDEQRSMILLSPRRSGSGWSRINKEKVGRLIAAGLMRPSGLAKVEAAKRNGSWARLESVDALIEPEDLRLALDGEPQARRHFDAFSPSSRRGILEWMSLAKQEKTRLARIAQTVLLAARNIKANHPPGRNAGPS
jgi:uncharacterized protein YdeI (YjbR/CyaY-like superfamily)